MAMPAGSPWGLILMMKVCSSLWSEIRPVMGCFSLQYWRAMSTRVWFSWSELSCCVNSDIFELACGWFGACVCFCVSHGLIFKVGDFSLNG